MEADGPRVTIGCSAKKFRNLLRIDRRVFYRPSHRYRRYLNGSLSFVDLARSQRSPLPAASATFVLLIAKSAIRKREICERVPR
jgi:hypothetical protein